MTNRGRAPTDAAVELAAERAHVDAAYERVQQLRRSAALVAEHAGAGAAASELEDGALFERDVAMSHASYRSRTLGVPRDRLCVGRIDGDLAGGAAQTLVIGRASVADADGEPMVVDWRAPAAAAFYRARAGDPMGVQRRRHYRWHDGELVGLDDEVLDHRVLDDGELKLVGEGALLAALTAPRTGRMTDIVGTIQADQDRIIRRPARGVTIVQGGPGTGKTAVALHRAAYLLYELAGRGDQSAVLFLGPNRTFLRYVSDVVPSLGEDQVVLATASDLGPEVAITADDTDEAGRVKGDLRMVEVLDRAVAAFQRPVDGARRIGCGRYELVFDPDDARRVIDRARRAEGTHNDRVRLVRRLVWRVLSRQYDERVERAVAAGRTTRDSAPAFADVVDRRAVRALAREMWPRVTPESVLDTLLSSREHLVDAGRDLLGVDEVDALLRPRGAGWTEADVALLDELAVLVGVEEAEADEASGEEAARLAAESFQLVEAALTEEMEAALDERAPDCPECGLELTFERRAAGTLVLVCTNFSCGGEWPAGEIIGDADAQLLAAIIEEISDRYAEPEADALRPADRRFAHVVVDEGQDVSAMQWRAIGRRCGTRAFTVVGDLDQGSRPWSLTSWNAVPELVGAGRDVELVELTVNYRTPAEVMRFATARVNEAGGSVVVTDSVRESGLEPEVRCGSSADVDAVLDEARSAVGAGRTVVAVVPESCPQRGRHDVVTATEVKGLEFDGVVVFDPDAIVAESARGARRLYVALTRTTHLLWVVEPPTGA